MDDQSWNFASFRSPEGFVFEVLYQARGLNLHCGYCRGIDFLESTPPQLRIVGCFKRSSSPNLGKEWAEPNKLEFQWRRHSFTLQREVPWMKICLLPA